MLARSLVLWQVLLHTATSYPDAEQDDSWNQARAYRPVNYMVDITNNLGINVLYEHNFLNDNNIAFSPYGLTGIMIALYEGIDGSSAIQMQKAMRLPSDRSIMRVGFRDIHRRLRSYFIPKEGFLAGLAFNNENVTFREEYKSLLQFYGYDFEMPKSTTKNDTTTLAPQSTETISTSLPTTIQDEESTTLSTIASTIASMTTETMDATTTSMPQMTDAESTSTESMSTMTSTLAMESDIETTTESLTTVQTSTEMTTDKPTSIEMTTGITATMEMTTGMTTTVEMTPSITTTIESESDQQSSTVIIVAEESTMSTATTDAETTTSTNDEANEVKESENTPSTRRKKSLYNNYDYVESRDQDQLGLLRPLFLKSPNYGGRGLQHHRSFLANGYDRVQITYMSYDTVLDFAYIPYLRSMALKLPLDTTEYYLLVILPEFEFGVNQLIKDLQSERAPTLRQINYMLASTHVHAWVPTFMLKGFIVLTTDLQKLGICDVFEPRQDDFKPMTKERNIYVRNIEQAITVTIRKYSEPSIKKRYVQSSPPVEFAATHPFLYFVMDSGLHVSLMAGKIINPLNSRII